ncbi:hypothetical protein [Candidatus Amarobacter glycogenicus]|uniref:hypothetical protein n=1 Tax=Candidatus Amarobacter glycogenicus TaxID=3140699 RepID=UPI0031376D57|nr:hypothetical protein [Dehalococcoidia bacterium]
MNRRWRLGLAAMALSFVLASGAGVVYRETQAIGFAEALVGRLVVQTIAAKRAERHDRRDVNERRDEELAAVDLRKKAVDYSVTTKRMTADEAARQKAQLDLQKIAIEERAKAERQTVSFQTRRRIDANLRATFTDAVKVATGADPKAVEFLAGLIQGKKPLQAAVDAAVAGQPQDPRQPFKDLQKQLKEVDKAAQALGGAKGIDIRARVKQALAETTGIADGEGPPPNDKLQKLKDLDKELSKALGQANDILRDLFPGSPGIDRSRFVDNPRWRAIDAEVQRLEGPVAGREAVSSIFRRAQEHIAALSEAEGLGLDPDEIDRLARDAASKWADQRKSGDSTARADQVDLDELIAAAVAESEGLQPADAAPASGDVEKPAPAPGGGGIPPIAPVATAATVPDAVPTAPKVAPALPPTPKPTPIPTTPPTAIPPATVAATAVPTPVPTPPPFLIANVAYPASVTSGGAKGSLVVTWSGQPKFPVTMHYQVSSCPAGASCSNPTATFATASNPLVFANAIWCFGVTQTLFFGYNVVLIDANGKSTNAFPAPFTCVPQ